MHPSLPLWLHARACVCTGGRGGVQGAFYEIARRIPPALQPPVYLLLHLCFCTATCVVAWACWTRFALHSALVTTCFTASLWHGGSYYFEVFAKRCASRCAVLQARLLANP